MAEQQTTYTGYRPAEDIARDLIGRNPFYDARVLRLLMNSLPPEWTERQKEYQARLQYADIRPFLKDVP